MLSLHKDIDIYNGAVVMVWFLIMTEHILIYFLF